MLDKADRAANTERSLSERGRPGMPGAPVGHGHEVSPTPEGRVPSRKDCAYRLLVELEMDGRASQRALSRDLGIALGLTNLLLRDLVRKGWVRVVHAKSNRASYLLTQAGIAEKARLSRLALQNDVRFYVEARDRIADRLKTLSAQWPVAQDGARRFEKRIVFYGGGGLAEIGYICLNQTDLRLVGVVDDHGGPFFGVPVFPRDQLRPGDVGGVSYEVVVVTTLAEVDEARKALEVKEIPLERIAWL